MRHDLLIGPGDSRPLRDIVNVTIYGKPADLFHIIHQDRPGLRMIDIHHRLFMRNGILYKRDDTVGGRFNIFINHKHPGYKSSTDLTEHHGNALIMIIKSIPMDTCSLHNIIDCDLCERLLLDQFQKGPFQPLISISRSHTISSTSRLCQICPANTQQTNTLCII